MIKNRAIIIKCDVNHFYNLVYFDELDKIKTIYESMKKIKGTNYFYNGDWIKKSDVQIKKDL